MSDILKKVVKAHKRRSIRQSIILMITDMMNDLANYGIEPSQYIMHATVEDNTIVVGVSANTKAAEWALQDYTRLKAKEKKL